MIPCFTPKARVGRVGVWASPLIAAVLLLVFLFVLPLSPPAQGTSQSSVLKQQLDQKVAALNEALAKYQTLGKELDALKQARDAAAETLASLDADITEVQAGIDQAELDLKALRTQLENRLVNMYKDGGSWSLQYLEALVVETNLTSMLDRFNMLIDMASQDERLFNEVEGYLEQSRQDKVVLEQKKAEQQAKADELVKSIEQLSAKQAQFETQKNVLQGQVTALRAQIKAAEAKEASAAASASAQLKQVSAAAQATTKSGTTYIPTSGGGGAEANFIYTTFLAPRKSVLSGQLVVDLCHQYGISIASCLAILNAETGMGSAKWGGRLVTEGNNFGCIKYSQDPSWLKAWSPFIPHGKIAVGSSNWMTFPTPAQGLEAWTRYIAYGLGKDRYRPLINSGQWVAFADIYYGKGIQGEAKYIERLTNIYAVLKYSSAAAGYNW